MNVLISGGTGLIGKELTKKLQNKGYSVTILTRDASELKENHCHWDIENRLLELECIENADYIIHLSGENIASKRWSTNQKKKLVDSRINSSRLILDKINSAKNKPKAIISASAIGYYGFSETDKTFSEKDNSAKDFLGKLCESWESEINKAIDNNIRTVNIRTGIVLTQKGGALAKMNKAFKLGFGAALGDGQQFMPWIHIDDLCEIYIKSIEDNSMNGAYNAVAPEHINNQEFSTHLAQVQGKEIYLPNIPGILLKILFGEMAQILLKGNKVSSAKIQSTGFEFKYSNLRAALNNLIGTT